MRSRRLLVLTAVAVSALAPIAVAGAGLEKIRASRALSDADVRALAIDPANTRILYAATTVGIFKTTNGAAVWRRVRRAWTRCMGVDPSLPHTVYVCASTGILKTTDGGRIWRRILRTLLRRSRSRLALRERSTPAAKGG